MKKKCGFQFDTTYTQLPQVLYRCLPPAPVPAPKMRVLNADLAEAIGLDFSNLTPQEQAQLFSGNQLPEEANPFAEAYAGHQFGHFTCLGDGRALVWGEHITPKGQRMDIQFKGSGRTPYSRGGDGKAVLGPMLREYMISEAMHHLGVPTTRSLAVAETGSPVIRDTVLPGAILTRIASSHIRVGTFEFAAAQGDIKLVQSLLDYTVGRHYPFLNETPNKALRFIEVVVEKQVDLIVHWMRVGFIHGVMNTDNMTVTGETIDYGPCAFMDAYHPHTVFSAIDRMGRYAYANQPKIAQWNIARLAETLLPLIHENAHQAMEMAGEAVHRFAEAYAHKWLAMMRAKLGLYQPHDMDAQIISDLLKWMQMHGADYTNTFLDLGQAKKPEGKLYAERQFEDWYALWEKRREQDSQLSASALSQVPPVNPVVIPRNHKVEEALQAANNGDFEPFYALAEVLKSPYQPSLHLQPYQTPPKPEERITQTFCGT